jgi:hypothetical protein
MKYIIKLVIVLTILLFIIPNSTASLYGIYQNDVEITVDHTSNNVEPGQEAIFHWLVYNNLTLWSIDFFVSSYGNVTRFSQNVFTLGPGEKRLIHQYCPTLYNDTNGTHYSYDVTWSGSIKARSITYNIPSHTWTLSVTVIDENENNNINDDYLDNFDNQNSSYGILNIGIIIFIGAILIILWKLIPKLKKDQLS